MALTEAQKLDIIQRIGAHRNFTSGYSEINRQWFVRVAIDYYAGRGTADADIERNVQTLVATCKTVVNAKKNFTIGVTFSREIRRQKLSRRIEILYGCLALKPELADAANSNFLDFICRRRYRAVMRMDYFVNPNYQGYFRYPNTCSTAGRQYQVNNDATTYWEPFVYVRDRYFKLTPPAGDSVLSIEKLFVRKSQPCQGNLLDCARTLSVLYMDSLFEAADKNTLLPYLESKPEHVSTPTERHPYLAICHPNSDVNTHFIMDNTSESLFSKPNVAPNNLQVGDHVYIYNHPLYKVFNPTGSWRGEHALVYALGNRDYRSNSGFMFGGHGKEGTLYQFYSAFLQELKTHLERVSKMAKIHLLFRQQGPVADGSSTLHIGSIRGSVNVTTTTQFRIFEYDVPFTYTDYEHSGRTSRGRRFVVAHRIGFDYTFGIDDADDAVTQINSGTAHLVTFVRNITAPATNISLMVSYDPQYYQISYTGQNGSARQYDLFDMSSGRLRIHQITINELFTDPFMLRAGTSDLYTTQPKVDVSATYLTYLRTRRAIS